MADAQANHGSIFKRIWVPFFILLGITALEFLIAFTVGKEYKGFKDLVFILMTLAKAFYIVAYFMHLKFERVTLIYSIVVPTLFVMMLIAILIYEGLKYFS